MVLHPNPVPEERPARPRAGRIHRHNADLLALPSVGRDQLVDQRALAGAGIAGDPDHGRVPLETVQPLQRGLAGRFLVLQQRDQARDRPGLSRLDAIC